MKKSTKFVLGTLGAAAVGNAVHAAVYRPKKEDIAPLPEEKVDVDAYRKHLSEAIQFKTVSTEPHACNAISTRHCLFLTSIFIAPQSYCYPRCSPATPIRHTPYTSAWHARTTGENRHYFSAWLPLLQ